jgi:phospholipase/carboxylesterase
MILGDTSRQRLQSAGYNVTWYTYSMQHTVTTEEIYDIGAWIRERFGA